MLAAQNRDRFEFDDDDSALNGRQSFLSNHSFSVGKSFSIQASIKSVKLLTILRDGHLDTLIQTDEALPARVPFQMIAQLTRLQQERLRTRMKKKMWCI